MCVKSTWTESLFRSSCRWSCCCMTGAKCRQKENMFCYICIVFTCVGVCVCVLPGEALRCNYCFSDDSNLCTPTGIQTCSGSANACGAVILQGALSKSSGQ